MRGRQRRRTRRQRSGGQRSGGQTGGDAPAIADLAEWKSRVSAKIAEMKRQTSEQAIAPYKFGDLTDAALTLPPYQYKEDNGTDTTIIPQSGFLVKPDGMAETDIRGIGASLKDLLKQSFPSETNVDAVQPADFQELAKLLISTAKESDEYAKSIAHMQNIENILRESTGAPAVSDLSDKANYPLYIWFLMMNTTVEILPLLTPALQEPAEQEE